MNLAVRKFAIKYDLIFVFRGEPHFCWGYSRSCHRGSSCSGCGGCPGHRISGGVSMCVHVSRCVRVRVSRCVCVCMCVCGSVGVHLLFV